MRPARSRPIVPPEKFRRTGPVTLAHERTAPIIPINGPNASRIIQVIQVSDPGFWGLIDPPDP